MFTPIGFFAEEAGGLPISFNPYAYYDALDPASYDATNKTWSDLAKVNTTDDSTFDTAVGNLPNHNSNGYWVINDQNAQDSAFTYNNSTSTTNPFSYLVGDVHTIFTYVRPQLYRSNAIDILCNSTSAGSVLLGTYDIGGSYGNKFARAHVWASAVQFTDGPSFDVTLGQWIIIGQRYTDVGGGQKRLDVFTCDVNGTVTITQGTNFTPGTTTSAPVELRVGARNTTHYGDYDIGAYALYKDDLSDANIQTVCNELSTRFGEPT